MRPIQGPFPAWERPKSSGEGDGAGDSIAMAGDDDRTELVTPLARELPDTELDPNSSGPVPVEELKTWPDDPERAEERDEVLQDFESGDRPGVIGRLGPFEILEPIGQGSMGLVFKARDTRLDRLVAIKVLSAPQTRHPEPRLRFLREARTAAAIYHENVVAVFAVDEHRGRPYLVMQYVDGISLQDLIDQQGPLSIPEVVRIGRQVALGLAAAHDQGLIHRDVKPSNILLERKTGRAMITDFGLARAVDDVGLTHRGVVSGTPSYMAPEQARGETIDHRADLFSLAGVLHAMCTGRPPFCADGTMAILRRVCEQPAESIRSANPDVPDRLIEIISRLHAKAPSGRYPSAHQVAEELGLVPIDEPGGNGRPPTDQGAPKPSPVQDGDPRFASRRRQRPRVLAGIVLAGLAVLFTEASGITRISSAVGTVFRIRTAEGILVLELDDPTVKIAVEGDGDEIIMSGAGNHEVRLRPGPHKLRATRGGVPVFDEILTISRGDRRVLRLSRERLGATSPAPTPLEARAVLSGHSGLVHAAAFSPDSRRIATAGYDKTIKLWDTEKGTLLTTLRGHDEPVAHVAFSPDGKILASASWDKSVRLWDAVTGEPIANVGKHENWAWTVVFSPDGKTLASAGADFVIRFWDPAQRTPLATFDTPGGVRDIAFSPDGGELAAALGWASERNLQLWKVKEKSPRLFTGHAGGTNSVAFLPDGRLISVGQDRMVRIWDRRGRQQAVLSGHSRPVNALSLLPSSHWFITSDGDFRETNLPGSVKLWDYESGRELLTFDGQGGPLFAQAVSADGRLLITGGADTLVRLWDVKQLLSDASGPESPTAAEPPGHP